MTKTTDNLGTPYPETTDIADVPKNLRDIGVSWDNAWGGVWRDWTPVVTQFESGEAAYMTIASTSVCRVRKVGKTVHIAARIDILAGTGHNGYPQVYLPYPVASIDSVMGWTTSFTAGFTDNGSPAATSTFSTLLNNPSIVEIYGIAAARVATDWIALFLEYETV